MDENLDLLKKLISFRTETENVQENLNCVSFLSQYLISKKIQTKIIKNKNTYCLIASKKLKKKYSVILCGHLDVVPGNDKLFSPKLKEGKLHGRGAADMKGCVVALISVLLSLNAKHKNPDVALILTTDEETGGLDGINQIVNKYNYRADCVIVPDTEPDYKILIETKGVLHIKFTSKGKSAHASTPWLGINAIENIFTFFKELEFKLGNLNKSTDWKLTTNIGKISGGNSTNSVADKCEIFVDIRYTNNVGYRKVIKEIDKLILKYPNIKYYELLNASPTFVDTNSRYIKKIAELIKKYKNKTPGFIKEFGNSDARYFSAKKIPVVCFNPKTSESHGNDEWIDINDLAIFKNILDEFVVWCCNIKSTSTN